MITVRLFVWLTNTYTPTYWCFEVASSIASWTLVTPVLCFKLLKGSDLHCSLARSLAGWSAESISYDRRVTAIAIACSLSKIPQLSGMGSNLFSCTSIVQQKSPSCGSESLLNNWRTIHNLHCLVFARNETTPYTFCREVSRRMEINIYTICFVQVPEQHPLLHPQSEAVACS